MPLNLSSIGPAGLSILNRWARERENDHNALKKQVADLQRVIQQLQQPKS